MSKKKRPFIFLPIRHPNRRYFSIVESFNQALNKFLQSPLFAPATSSSPSDLNLRILNSQFKRKIEDMRDIQLVSTTRPMKEISEDEDLSFWLSRPVVERLRALTCLVSQLLAPGQGLDKSAVMTRKLKAN